MSVEKKVVVVAPRRRARSMSMGPATSACSRGWKRCACAPACISARPTSAACTTWSTRCGQQRRRGGHRRRRPHRRGHPPDGTVHGQRQRPRHPGGHARQEERQVGARSGHDHAARRRQVRLRQLQDLRRPARRGRLGGQRALRVVRVEVRRDGKVYAQEYERGVPKGPVKVVGKDPTSTARITMFKADPHDLQRRPTTITTFLAQRFREMCYLNTRPRDHLHRRARRPRARD